MSDTLKPAPVSALNHASFDGLVHIEECGLQGMITVRGDLDDRAVRAAIAKAVGVDVPAQTQTNVTNDAGLCWMSPDELLLLCPYDDVDGQITALSASLAKLHHLAADVSDARASFRLQGDGVREVLAKLCPVDLSPDSFEPGMFRRTRMAQVPAAFWLEDEQTARIICFRSVADYVFGLLKAAAHKGAQVGYF